MRIYNKCVIVNWANNNIYTPENKYKDYNYIDGVEIGLLLPILF